MLQVFVISFVCKSIILLSVFPVGSSAAAWINKILFVISSKQCFFKSSSDIFCGSENISNNCFYF